MRSIFKSINSTFLGTLPVVAIAVVTLPIATSPTLAQALLPNETINGKTQAELSAEWWKYVTGIPVDDNPLIDPTGDKAGIGQSGSIFFLFDSITPGEPTSRKVTIADDKTLFFPIYSWMNVSYPANTETAQQLLSAISPALDDVTSLYVKVDGIEIPNLFSYRQVAPTFKVNLPENNVFGVEAGVLEPAVSDGYWVALSPLAIGEHTLTFGAYDSKGMVQENTYNISAVPEPTTVLGLVTCGILGAAKKLRRRSTEP